MDRTEVKTWASVAQNKTKTEWNPLSGTYVMRTLSHLKPAFKPLIIFWQAKVKIAVWPCTQKLLHVGRRCAADKNDWFSLFCLDAAVRWARQRDGKNKCIKRTRVGKKWVEHIEEQSERLCSTCKIAQITPAAPTQPFVTFCEAGKNKNLN